MQNQPFTDLNFDRHWRLRLGGRAIWLLTVAGVYILAWFVIPPMVLFWLGLPLVSILAWVASFSWREALHAVDQFIHRIDTL